MTHAPRLPKYSLLQGVMTVEFYLQYQPAHVYLSVLLTLSDDVVVIEPTCEALPAVEGDTVAVTCDFGVDVSHQHLWSSIGVELKPSSGGAGICL